MLMKYKMNIVTSVCIDNIDQSGEVIYPMISASGNRRDIYWRCAATLMLTSIKVNPEVKHIIFTNDKNVFVQKLDIRELLLTKGVEVVYLSFYDYNPGNYSKKFRNAFYKHEVMHALGNYGEPSILLDCDCVWSRRDNELLELIAKGNYLLLQDTYQRGHTPLLKEPHGISMEDMGKLFKTIPVLDNQKMYPIWYGGEIIAGSQDHFREVSDNVLKVLEYCKKQLDSGKFIAFNEKSSIFDNDEYISSYVFNSLKGINILDSYGKYSRRIWTAPYLNNVVEKDVTIAIWHLTAEKETGFNDLFNDIISEKSLFWRTDTNTSQYLGRYFGIPRREGSLNRTKEKDIKSLKDKFFSFFRFFS